MRIAVLDGNSLMNRAFYGIRELANRDGVPTNALLGFMNMLAKLHEEDKAAGVIVCFDRKEPTFRHLRYDGYKANRHEMPEELARQMPLVRELLDSCGVPWIELAGYEADDLLGTIAARNAANGGSTVLVTGDRDSFQLISTQTTVRLMTTANGKPEMRLYDLSRISQQYGVTPRELIDVKALMGDTSDNIPGVRGIGEKTALSLIRSFHSMDRLYERLETARIRPLLAERLREQREQAYMSRELAEICRSVPIEVDLSAASWPNPDHPGFYEFLDSLDLRSVITRWGVTPTSPVAPRQELSYQKEMPDFGSPTAFWLEGEQAAVCDGTSCAVITGRELLDYLSSSLAPKCGFDNKLACRYLLAHGRSPITYAGDIQLCGYLLSEGTEFEEIALRRGYEEPEEQETGLFAADGGEERLLRRAAVLFALWKPMEQEVTELGMDFLYREAELPLCAVLARMEHTGIALDAGRLAAFGDSLREQTAEAETRIYSEAGHPFNPNSPKQLGTVLFEELKLPGGRKTRTGWSTDAEILEKCRDYPIVDAVLTYRQLMKLRTTYVDGLLKCTDADGRVRTHFHQTGTATGRLSASDPNLQNMPVRQEIGGEIRRCFLPSPGYAFADADYSQIELRVLAHLSGDEQMCRAFSEGTDIHTLTASQVFNLPPEEVTPAQRSRAKAVNFGIVYGISDFSLAEDIHVSRKEAGEYIESYFAHYPAVRAYMDGLIETARETGYVTTLYGRRRAVRDIRAGNFNLRTAAERIARNTPIQGTAADIIKLAMVRADAALRKEFPHAHLLLQVHDELLCEAPIEEIERVRDLLVREMENAVSLSVRLAADGSIGDNWLSCK